MSRSSSIENTCIDLAVIFPNSPAAGALPAAEVEKRQASFNARKALLRSNPSLYISKTRLSIRQIPLFVTDRTLKKLALYAVRAFNDEVKSAEREALARSEELDETLSSAVAGKKTLRGERPTAVIQSKVVRSKEKSDPMTGLGRSRGYGFLEMRTHKDALKVLRWANNNPALGALLWEWWIAESKDVLERTKRNLDIARKGGKGASTEAADPEGKKQDSVEDLEGRVRLLEARLSDRGGSDAAGMRGGKTLLIEFSIENVLETRRCKERATLC